MTTLTRWVTLCAAGALALAGSSAPAQAIPVFAHRYGFTCQTCHTLVPHLNSFGARFLENGYRIAGLAPHGALPLAVKIQLAYGSDVDPSHLPKALVDELELLTGGAVGTRMSYFAETYLIDGGRPGAVRDAWAAYHVGAVEHPFSSATLTAGQFTLPLPIDPETFRETQTHYAIWDQVVGSNPFNFFSPHQGAALEFGSGGATTLTVAALAGHDPRSGIAAYGIDRMEVIRHEGRAISLSAYRYDGARHVTATIDRFWRQGYGLGAHAGPVEFDAVYQHGFDSDATGGSVAIRSSGGFAQLRYALGSHDFALVRYDGTQDVGGPYRALVFGAGHRFHHNTRLTFEDVMTHTPQTRNTFAAALLFAY